MLKFFELISLNRHNLKYHNSIEKLHQRRRNLSRNKCISSSVYISFPKERGNGSCLDDSVTLCIILLQCLFHLFAILTFKIVNFCFCIKCAFAN